MKNAIATRKPAPSPEPSHKVEVRTSEFGNAYVRVTFDGSDEILSTAASHMLVSLYLRAYKAARHPIGKLCMPSVDHNVVTIETAQGTRAEAITLAGFIDQIFANLTR